MRKEKLKEEFRGNERLCLCRKTYCCYDGKSEKPSFLAKFDLKKALIKVLEIEPCQKVDKFLRKL